MALKKFYNISVTIEIYSKQSMFNTTTKKWTGVVGDVSH